MSEPSATLSAEAMERAQAMLREMFAPDADLLDARMAERGRLKATQPGRNVVIEGLGIARAEVP